MNERTQVGLRLRRRVQIVGWGGLIGVVACFIVLLLLERRLEEEHAAIVRGALLVCLLVHLGSIAYLRSTKCPACGERFLGSGARGFGSFTAMSQKSCDHCGATLAPDAIR
jgi:hypothetical protein